MTFRTSVIVLLTLVAIGGAGCDFYPGSKYSYKGSYMTWDPITDGNCLTIGTYVMDVMLGSTPFQGKSKIKISPQDKDDREFLPNLFSINYTVRRGMTSFSLYNLQYALNKGKGKNQFISQFNLLAGDEIDVEACADGGDVPAFSRVDMQLLFKFDKL